MDAVAIFAKDRFMPFLVGVAADGADRSSDDVAGATVARLGESFKRKQYERPVGLSDPRAIIVFRSISASGELINSIDSMGYQPAVHETPGD